MVILFWFFAGLIFYAVIGFPAIAFLLCRIKAKPVKRGFSRQTDLPKVSMIIAAYNEEKVIEAKLQNALSLNYPKDKLEIIVISDGSTDRTPSLVETFAQRGIVSLYRPERRGKTPALNRAVEVTTGEILVFADANNSYNADALLRLVRDFEDPEVGGVSGRKSILKDETRFATEGEATYWQYESFLKWCESQLGSIATADGEIFAIRRALFSPIPEDIVHDDMALTLDLIRQGYRVVYEPEAVSSELASQNPRDEYHIKIRLAAGGYQIISRFRGLLLPPRNLFAVVFLSHKFLRWAMPCWLIGLFLTNLFLADSFYRLLMIGQTLFYVTGALGAVLGQVNRHGGILYFPYYFCMVNLAAFVGLIRFVAGTQQIAWKRAER